MTPRTTAHRCAALITAALCLLFLGTHQMVPDQVSGKEATTSSPAVDSSSSPGQDQRADRKPEMTEEGLELPFYLDKGGFVTAAVVDEKGAIVRTLVRDTYFAAGENTVTWDLRSEGHATGRSNDDRWRSYDIEREAAGPGQYRLELLTHEGITPRYEFSVQSPGNPPWHTSNNTGAWLSDHAPPSDVLSIGDNRLLVSASVAETGHMLMILDESGQKRRGYDHLGNGMNGPKALAAGENSMAWAALDPRDQILLIRLREGGGKKELKTSVKGEIRGLTQTEGIVIASYTDGLVFATEDLEEIGTTSIEDIRGIAADGQTLYALVGQELRKYRLDAPAGSISGSETLASDLEDPQRLLLHEGELYVSDWGESHQVKVFTTDGSHQRTIGKAGGPQQGRYDEERMSHPLGMAVDSEGRLWLAEDAYMPKRLSIWNAGTGAFEKAFYGPPKYGGGLVLDPLDRTRAYYAGHATGTIEFELDWEKGTSKPSRILLNREKNGHLLPQTRKRTDAPDQVRIGPDGERYLFSSSYVKAHILTDKMSIWRLEGDEIVPVAIIGKSGDWGNVFENEEDYPEIAQRAQRTFGDASSFETTFLWQDFSGEMQLRPENFQFKRHPERASRRPYLGDDFNIHLSDGHVLPFTGEGWDLSSAQQYDFNTPDRGDIVHGEGISILSSGPVDGYKDAKRIWRLHSQWPVRVDGAPVSRFRGDLIRTTHLLSPPLPIEEGEAETLTAINSEHGELYLLTGDGYFLTTLFGDKRTAPLWRYSKAERGMAIEGVSPSDEHFRPWLMKSEGEIYLTAGKEHSSILRLDGLANVRREREEPFEVSPEMVADIEPETILREETRSKEAELPAVVEISAPEGLRAEISYEGGWKVVYETPHEDLLRSSGDLYHLFAEGGGLDLLVDGKRLFVTRRDGELTAVLYEEGDGYHYTSPIGETRLKATDVTDRISLEQEGGTYRLFVEEGVLPEGEELKADVGVIIGDGQEAKRRIYWARGEAITADLPSEARLDPDSWGTWKPSEHSRSQ